MQILFKHKNENNMNIKKVKNYFLRKYQVYEKPTFFMYGLHSLQGQFTGFHFCFLYN